MKGTVKPEGKSQKQTESTSGFWLFAFGFWLLAFMGAVSMPAATPEAAPSTAAPTFSESVAPILYANCVTCHRPGEAAPFSLISYDDVKKRGTTIAKATAARYMPPWHAEHGYGEFADERRLTDEQIATIGAWVAGGMPEGDRKKMPAVPSFTDGWQLGKPDLILEMPVGFEVPADGPDIYRNFAIATGTTEDKYVRAVEFRPSARRVVHHAIFQFARGGAATALDGKDGKAGFSGAMPAKMVQSLAPAGDLGGWAVGTTPRFMPENLSLTMNKGSDFVLQLHFHPTGKVEMERSTIGLYFASAPPPRKVRELSAPGLFGALSNIDIPPGEKDYVIKATARTWANMRFYNVLAHAHYLGKEFKAIATLPDGTTRQMLWIKDWDFNWQDRYVYKEPVEIPKGTKIDVTIRYDNSADNPRNPCTPPVRVRFGLQSYDEMGSVIFQTMTSSDADEKALDEFNAAIAAAVMKQVANNDTVKRIGDQLRSGTGLTSGCAPSAPMPVIGLIRPGWER
jgi:mono/diheme cytochrome c family protein